MGSDASWSSQVAQGVKNQPAHAGDTRFHPWVGTRHSRLQHHFLRVAPSTILTSPSSHHQQAAHLWFLPAGFNNGGFTSYF